METELEEEIKEELHPVYRRPKWTEDGTPLTRINFAPQETGWAYSMGDDTYRLANMPIISMCTGYGDAVLPEWGDLVRVNGGSDELKYLEVIEKYDKEAALVADHLAYYKECTTTLEKLKEKHGDNDYRVEEQMDHMDNVWLHLSEEEKDSLHPNIVLIRGETSDTALLAPECESNSEDPDAQQ